MKPDQVFERFVPPKAVAYCVKLYDHLDFEFKVKRARKTKLGDYRFTREDKKHTITVNNDLNKFAFLVTYLHEVAHLITFNEFKGRVDPHGNEWKENFKKIASPMLTEDIFEKPVLVSLKSYFKNPKASSCSDPVLYQVLKKYDPPSDKLFLKELEKGDLFTFNEKTYKVEGKRRTRIEALHINTNRLYLISQLAEVSLIGKKTS